MDELLKELKEIKALLKSNDKNDLLTVENVHKEYGIGINTARKMFNDPKLPVQRYTVPFKVTRKALEEYMNTSHDYLCER